MKKGHVTVHVRPELKKRLKQRALNENTTIKALVDEALVESLKPKAYRNDGY